MMRIDSCIVVELLSSCKEGRSEASEHTILLTSPPIVSFVEGNLIYL
jgi:hypothetical protein